MYDTLEETQAVLTDVCTELAHYGHHATSTPGNPWRGVSSGVRQMGEELKRTRQEKAKLINELALLQERIGNR